MNSLDYIDKEIMFTQKEENNVKTQIESTPNNRELQIQKDALTIKLKVIKERLSHLKQIKSELEAWEEIKKYIIVAEGHLALYDSIYEYIELENGCIDESNSEEEGISIMVIKKALEVKENVD